MSTRGEAYTLPARADKPSRADHRRQRHEDVQEAKLAAKVASAQMLQELVRLGLEAFVQEVGLRGLEAGAELEATALCGPKGRHDPKREAVRYGHTRTSVRVLGRRVTISRPRVRLKGQGGEVSLSLWEQARANDEAMRRAVMAAAVGGVSQRGLGPMSRALVGAVAPGRSVFGNSSSSVNRIYVEASAEVVREMRTRPLTGGAYRILYFDAVVYGGYRVVAAVGVRDDGEKEVLGLVLGSTENHVVCGDLIEQLYARGLRPDVARLVVVDGGKGILKAIEGTMGRWAVVQRCAAHKWRNLEAKLPREQWAEAKRVVTKAWRQSEAAAAEQELRTLAWELAAAGYQEAAASLREGLEETLAVARLGLGHTLRRKLLTTNTIESAFSTVGRTARRVTNWQSGDQALRWVAVGLKAAQGAFRTRLSAAEVAEVATALDRAVLPLIKVHAA